MTPLPPAFLPLSTFPLSSRPRLRLRLRLRLRPRRNATRMATGPYQVGILDCRLPSTHSPTIRLRLYYPTSNPSSTVVPWLPNHPFTNDQSRNILSFLTLPPLTHPILRPILTSLSQQPLPASNGPPILPGSLPVALFSHGLGGSVGGYATFCINLASHGRVVIAPEHSDGSAFVAYSDDSRIPYTRHNPAIHGPDDRVFRNRQLDTRLADLRRVLACLQTEATFVPLKRELVCPTLTVNTAEIMVTGHSFGGATALLFGAEIAARKIVCLDAWLHPVHDLTPVELGSSDCLFVDMGAGMKQSVLRRRELSRPAKGGVVDAVAIRGALHNNSSDFPARLPLWIAVMAGMTARGSDPGRILDLQNAVVERFLGSVETWREFRDGLGDKVEGEVVVAPVGRARSIPMVRQ